MENFFKTRLSISATYRIIGSNKPRYITNVYGPTTPRDKNAFIRNLEGLATLTSGSKWILGGDFNLICNLDEKRGGTRRIMVESGKFQGVIDNLGLIDMKTPNGLFTCMNRRLGAHQVAFRLDRFLIFDSHLMEGTTLEAHILDAHGSAHWPIQLWLDIPASPGCKPFRFERFWLQDVQIPTETQKLQATTQIMEQTNLR
jgi:hypothetical protein